MDIDEKEYRQQLVHLSQLDGPVHYAEIWSYADAYADLLWEKNAIHSLKNSAEVVLQNIC